MKPAPDSGTVPRWTGLRSMTGYGRGAADADGIRVVVEMASVNRRQLDVRLNLPRMLALREPVFIEMVRGRLTRGYLTANLTVDIAAAGELNDAILNEDKARAWVRVLRETAARLDLADDLQASILPGLPGVLPEGTGRELPPGVESVAVRAFDAALDALCSMRETEGVRLREDLSRRLNLLSELLDAIGQRAPEVAAACRELLQRRLAEAGEDAALEDEVFRRELLFYIGRCDVTEEITRLRSHFEQATGFLNATEPVGRTLDFLVQEMAREINTLGSKASDAAISRDVVGFKTELERFREQVQNVE